MNNSNNFQQIIIAEFKKLLSPLVVAGGGEQHFYDFFDDIGWNMPYVLGDDSSSLLNQVQNIISTANLIEDLIENPPNTLPEVIETLSDLVPIIEQIRELKNVSINPLGLAQDDLAQIPVDVLEYLTVKYLFDYQPKWYSFFQLIGVVKFKEDEPIIIIDERMVKIKRWPNLDFSALPTFIGNPTETLAEIYWPDGFPDLATTNEVADKLFGNIANLLRFFSIKTHVGSGWAPLELDLEVEEKLAGTVTAFRDFLQGGESPEGIQALRVGASMRLLSEQEDGPGISVYPFGMANFDTLIDGWTLNATLSADVDRFIINEDGAQFINNGAPGEVDLNLKLSKNISDDDDNALTIGSSTGTRLEIGELSVNGRLKLGDLPPDYGIALDVKKGAFIVSPGDGDGFIKRILPAEGLRADFDFLLGWAKSRGFHFGGSAGLQVSIPIRKPILGFLDLKSIDLGIKADEEGIAIQAGTSGNVELGPLTATVDQIGLQTLLTFPQDGGNLGVMNADLKFKPPSGIGLQLDSKGFKGGGYLYLGDNRYVGVVTLNFKEKINFTAIGILTTKNPDGSEGFSLMLIITADGFKPIQLGLGFTLDGVGGMIALNRTMKIDALRQGLRSDTLDNILFPDNPVENISLIVQDLETVFPIEQGRFVFGPMAKIGWGGAKSVLVIELGLIIEVPNPVRIAIPGILKTLLPKEDSKILNIKVNFLGTIEFDKKMIAFDASIFDSRLLKFTLEGDMAFRLIWGSRPNFLLSVGGFHPEFIPPPLQLLDMRRLSISLLAKENANIRLETYFAVTSNTVQLGARVDLLFKAWKVSVVGYIGFDALFQFNPFRFVISAGAMFAVRWGSKDILAVDLAFRLEGPTPWRAKGTAKFKVLFVKVKVNFDKTFGEKKDTSLPDIAVVPLLLDALENNDSWLTEIPDGRNELVKIQVPVTNDVVVHPAGTFTIQQEVLPLKSTIDKFGNQKTSDGNYFEITEVSLDGNNLDIADTQGLFAPAQYLDLEDKAKLNAPSFQKFKSGVKVKGTEDIQLGACTKRDIIYETILIDNDESVNTTTEEPAAWMNGLRRGGSVSRSPLSYQNKAQAKFKDRQIKKLDDAYRIVNSVNMAPYTGLTYTYSEARETLAALISLNPNLEGLIQIIPVHELVTVSTGGGVIGAIDDLISNQLEEDDALISEMAGAY